MTTEKRGPWKTGNELKPYTKEDGGSPPGELATAFRHGAWSPAVYEPLAQQFIERVIEVEAYLSQPQYRDSLVRWSVAEARTLLYSRYLARVESAEAMDDPEFDPDRTSWCRMELHRWQRRALEEAKELGLTPLSRSKLGKNVTQTALNVAEIWNSTPARGREEDGR